MRSGQVQKRAADMQRALVFSKEMVVLSWERWFIWEDSTAKWISLKLKKKPGEIQARIQDGYRNMVFRRATFLPVTMSPSYVWMFLSIRRWKSILGLKKVGQRLCHAHSAMTQKCDQYKWKASKAKIDAKGTPVAPDSSASQDAMFCPSYELRTELLIGRNALLLKLSKNDNWKYLILHRIAFLNAMTCYGHAFQLKLAVIPGLIFRIKICGKHMRQGFELEIWFVTGEAVVSRREVLSQKCGNKNWSEFLGCFPSGTWSVKEDE